MSPSIHPQAKTAYVFDDFEGGASLKLGGIPRGMPIEGIVTFPLTVSSGAALIREIAAWIARQSAAAKPPADDPKT